MCLPSAPRGYKLENLRKLEELERQELADSEEDDRRPVLPLKKSKAKVSHSYRNKMENWENAEVLNMFPFCSSVQLLSSGFGC